MALVIYQIGDAPLFFNLVAVNNDKGIEVKADRSWRAPEVKFTGVSGSHSYLAPGRPFVNDQKLDLKGNLICEDEVSGQRLMHRLMSMGGLAAIPVIGFQYEECIHDNVNICCPTCQTTIEWIVNYGVITTIGRANTYASNKEPWEFSVTDVAITMQIGSRWKALSSWEWEYRRNRIDNPLFAEPSGNLFPIPTTFSALSAQAYFFRWGLSLSKYDPLFWEMKYADGRHGGQGANFAEFNDHQFFSDPEIWSAMPNSVYAFTNFSNDDGAIQLEVLRNNGIFKNTVVTEVSSLDLSSVTTDLQAIGVGGLQTTDTIITGYAQPFPGFIIRDGEIIEGVRPKWSYPGNYPGETGRAANQVRFIGDSVAFHSAYLHDFGVY